MDEEPTPTEALDVSVPQSRRLRPWMIVAGASVLVVVIAGIVVALLLARSTTGPTAASAPSSTPQATARPTSSATAKPSPTATPTEAAPVAQPESGDQQGGAPAAPPAAAPPANPGPPALPPPPAPIITPTITTFTATNFNDSSQTIAQGCAASANGELAVRITWATENTTPTIKFRTQVSGSPPIDSTITGYSVSGQNHYFQLRCAKIAYVTMTFHSDNLERQARLTIDGNGPAGWSYLN